MWADFFPHLGHRWRFVFAVRLVEVLHSVRFANAKVIIVVTVQCKYIQVYYHLCHHSNTFKARLDTPYTTSSISYCAPHISPFPCHCDFPWMKPNALSIDLLMSSLHSQHVLLLLHGCLLASQTSYVTCAFSSFARSNVLTLASLCFFELLLVCIEMFVAWVL